MEIFFWNFPYCQRKFWKSFGRSSQKSDGLIVKILSFLKQILLLFCPQEFPNIWFFFQIWVSLVSFLLNMKLWLKNGTNKPPTLKCLEDWCWKGTGYCGFWAKNSHFRPENYFHCNFFHMHLFLATMIL